MSKTSWKKNNDNFYYIKELQWANKAAKMNTFYSKKKSQLITTKADSVTMKREKLWNDRFVYSKIPIYDSTKDKNVLDPNLLKIPSMNCYYNVIKSNNLIKSITSTKKRIRGKTPCIIYKSNEKDYLNCSNKNFKNSKYTSLNSSTRDIFANNNNLNSRLFSPLENDNNIINNNNINNISNQNYAEKIICLWNDLCIQEPYRELFKIILKQLNEERKNEIYKRELYELLEIKNIIQSLSLNVYYRLKTIDELSNLNDKLGLMLKSKNTESNEVILKKISNKIEKLREYTVDLCFAMKIIKEKINAGHPWGKYDLDKIAEKYKFDKNYLIKMKDEMIILREGYTKYFFNIGDDQTPFLLNSSKKSNNDNNNIEDPFMHIVPLNEEINEYINQCIYIIYQELIGYQNNNVAQSNYRHISPLKKYNYNDKEIKMFKAQIEDKENINININNNKDNNLIFQNKGFFPYRTFSIFKNKKMDNQDYNKVRLFSGGEKIIIKNQNEKINLKQMNTLKLNSAIESHSMKNINNIKMNKDKINIDEKYNKKDNNDNFHYNSVVNTHNNNNDNVMNKKKENRREKNSINNYNQNENEESPNNSHNINIHKDNTINEKININNNNEKNKENNINNNNISKDNIAAKENNDDDNNINKIKDKRNDINNSINKENKMNYDDNKRDTEKKEDIKKLNNSDINNKNNLSKSSKKSKKKNNNKISSRHSYKNLKVEIFAKDINLFSKEFYESYYQLIPNEIKDMFNIKQNIISHLLKGISPYLIYIYDDIHNSMENNWINIENNIYGICTFNYIYIKNKLKIIINHISTSIIFDEEDKNKYYVNDIKKIFELLINFIKNEFYFDEIIIEYDTNKKNEDLLNIFINELKFTISYESDNEDKENNNIEKNVIKEEDENNNKLVYVNNSTRNTIDKIIRQSVISYYDKKIFDIFNSLLITNNYSSIIPSDANRTNKDSIQKALMSLSLFDKNNYNTDIDKNNSNSNSNYDENLINKITMNYLLEVKEEKNIKILYNKLTKLDQLIKFFNKNNIKNNEIPITIAQNIFDILSVVINKTTINNYFNNHIIFNNYNLNEPNSFFDKNSNVFYNFIIPEKIIVFHNSKYKMNFYHIINKNLSLFFSNVNDDIIKFLTEKNIYVQINEIYKDTIMNTQKKILYNKIIWIPCFDIYNHFKCLSNNSVGTIHEYVKISNKPIKQMHTELFKINNNNFLSNGKNGNLHMKIEPDYNRDIIFDNDFIFGIINNTEILTKNINNIFINNNEDNEDEKENNNNDVIIDDNNMPYITFMSFINKSNFIGDDNFL